MTDTKTTFYIGLKGEDMETRINTMEEIEDVMKDVAVGFTISAGVGGWKGKTEESAIVEIINVKESLTKEFEDRFIDSSEDRVIDFLKKFFEDEFEQDSVGVFQVLGEARL